WGLTLALVCTLLALVLPMHSLEPFLLLLSSVFVPLYGVILGRLGMTAPHDTDQEFGRLDGMAAASWLGGIALYHVLAQWAPACGSALQALAVTFVAGWLSRRTQAPGRQA